MHLLKNITLFLFGILLSYSQALAQNDSAYDYYKKDFFRYENAVYKPNIRTVQLAMSSWELTSPIIQLNSDEKLKLGFDDFDVNIKQYSYSIIHCDMDWNPSNISPTDYIDGYQDELISDYKNSFNTIPSYIHYQLIFPTDVMKITKSGNYVLKVFVNGNSDDVIISRRFMVYESKVTVDARVHQATIISDRNYKQEIDFTEDDVCDWIDEIGGIFNPEGQILLYLKYIVEHTVMAVQGTPKEEKKKSSKVRLG